jgi:hypothetical protein
MQYDYFIFYFCANLNQWILVIHLSSTVHMLKALQHL